MPTVSPAADPDAPRRASRLARCLNLVALVNAEPRRWQRRALAARYGVSERQITKDLVVIEAALEIGIGHVREGYYLDRPLLPRPR